jgi:4-amino-4-deoxy-L-arabinose transferase-like glycosyltransferase
MPLVLVGLILASDVRRLPARWVPLSAAAILFALPVGAWVVARYQVDEWRFLERMFHYDFVALSTRPLEGHTGTPLYYLNVLQKDQYDWLLAAVGALVLFPIPVAGVRRRLMESPRDRHLAIVCGAWISVTLLIPTLMQTKLAWYLTPFFPVFAVLVGAALAHGLTLRDERFRRRRSILAGMVLLALAVAESKLIWYSHNMRDLRFSGQGLMLAEREQLAGRRVFRDRWPRAGRFVLEHIVGAEPVIAADEQEFLMRGAKGDFILLSNRQVGYSKLPCIRSNVSFSLCRYPDGVDFFSPPSR